MMPLPLSSRPFTPYPHLKLVEEEKLYVMLEQTDKSALITALNSSQRFSLKTLNSLLYKAFSEESAPDVVASMIKTRSYTSKGVLAHIIVEAMNNRSEDNEQELFVYELLSCVRKKVSLLTEVLEIVSGYGNNLNYTSSLIEDLIQLAVLSTYEKEQVVHACPYMSEFILIDEVPFSNIVDDIKTKIGHFLEIRDLLRYGQTSKNSNKAMHDSLKTRTTCIDLRRNVGGTLRDAMTTLAEVSHLNLSIDPTDEEMQFIGQLVNLRALDLTGGKMKEAGLRHLQKLTNLNTLNLTYTALTDAGLHHLQKLTNLNTLNLERTAVADAGLHHLEKLTKLNTLNLAGTAVTDAGLLHLEKLTNLNTLNLGRTKVADARLHHLEKLTNLNTLNLMNTAVTDAGLQYLAKLTHLQKLYLGCPAVTDAGLQYLANLTHLQFLNLWGTAVTDAGLQYLANFTHLQTLRLGDSAVTSAGEQRLKKLLPNLNILSG